MSRPFRSDSWYRIAHLKPTLRPHVRVHRHRYRGKPWYLLQESASDRILRINAATARFVEQLDGRRTLEDAWSALVSRADQQPPRQDELIDVLAHAHSMDLLQVDLPPEIATMARRRSRQRRSRIKNQVLNPLSIKLPLIDPDRFLSATLWFVRPVLNAVGLAVWAAIVVAAATAAIMNWTDLTSNWHDRLLGLGNVVALWLIYPFVKAVHELGHGYAVKALGGQVHEMGVMFIYFTPIPYVDASAANAYPNRWHRVLVSAAGIMVELFLAAIAMALWLAAEPGLFRTIAFNVMVICGVSTVIFNGNPLMRYDGYFMLADALEMPNIAQRASRFWSRLIQKYLLQIPVADEPHSTGERVWILLYQPLAVMYRLFVSLSIALWLAADYFFIGVALAIGICWSSVLKPLLTGLRFVASDGRLSGRRGKVIAGLVSGLCLACAVLVLVPLPFSKTVEGVVWVPDDAELRVAEDGFVVRVLEGAGSKLAAGQPVVISSDDDLAAQLQLAEARIQELEVEYTMKAQDDRVAAEMVRIVIDSEAAALNRLRERESRLIARTNVSGFLSLASHADLEGRYLRKGELLGYVLNDAPRVIRVVVQQDLIDLIRSHLVRATLRVASNVSQTHSTRVVRQIPAGMNELPSAALGISGGGTVVQDPTDAHGMRSLDRVFQFDFELNRSLTSTPIGTRAYVKLWFENESAFNRVRRSLRQLFLKRLGI
jgi:putative peptide zinc metalloprotease protein